MGKTTGSQEKQRSAGNWGMVRMGKIEKRASISNLTSNGQPMKVCVCMCVCACLCVIKTEKFTLRIHRYKHKHKNMWQQ